MVLSYGKLDYDATDDIPRWQIRNVKVITSGQIFKTCIAGFRHTWQWTDRHVTSALKQLTEIAPFCRWCCDTHFFITATTRHRTHLSM